MYAEKYSESSLQGGKMLGNDNVRRKNARNRQYKVGKCSELSMQGERMLGIIDVHRKKCSKSPMKGEKIL